jgi:N-acetylglucosaminyldiphosphoundecaprenol N-acetyl-beta-D-mannosaminyltransferase
LKKKIKIINYLINPITTKEFIKQFDSLINSKKLVKYVCVSAVHGAVESFYNKKYQLAHDNASVAVPDGRPIYWVLKLFGYKTDHLPGYYVTDKICQLANKNNYSIGIYGSSIEVQKKFITKIKKRYKKIRFDFLYAPPFRKMSLKEKKKIQKEINKSKVDILFVALGAPKQEIWMYNNFKKINCVSIGIGAAIDFISENKRLAPKFMEFIGLAWLFRLLSEPRRLFWRYFSTNFLFIFLFFLQITGLKKFK